MQIIGVYFRTIRGFLTKISGTLRLQVFTRHAYPDLAAVFLEKFPGPTLNPVRLLVANLRTSYRKVAYPGTVPRSSELGTSLRDL